MSKNIKTADNNFDWLSEIPEAKVQKHVNLEHIYSTANDELSLQQQKRDQIITLYLAMITFFIPFTIELESTSPFVKGFMFLFLSIIGFILGLIVIRYRIYKEVYWITLRALAQMKNYNDDEITKQLVQSLYFKSLCKVAR